MNNRKIVIISIFLAVIGIISGNILLFDEKNKKEDLQVEDKQEQQENQSGKEVKKIGYVINDGSVYFGDTLLDEAPQEFQILSESTFCAKGEEYFYIREEKTAQFNKESLEVLGYGYAKDKNYAYYNCKVIEQADVESFHGTWEHSGEFIDKNFGYTDQISGSMEVYPLDDFWFLGHDEGGKNLGGNYRKYKNKIYYWDEGPHAVPSMVELDLDPAKVVTRSKFYIKDDKKVYADGWFVIKDADAKSFKDLGNGYGKDMQHAFYRERMLDGADVETFESISNNAWRNKPEGYYIRGDRIRFYDERLEGAMGHYGKDKNHVFMDECMIDGATPYSFKPISFGYSEDEKGIFYRCKKVERVDRDSFQVLDRGMQITGSDFTRDAFSKDDKSVFVGSKELDNLDVDTFSIVDSLIVKDKNGVYTYGSDEDLERIDGADTKTFVSLDYMYAKDSGSVYCYGKKVDGADAESFTSVNNKPGISAKDKNYEYHVCDVSN